MTDRSRLPPRVRRAYRDTNPLRIVAVLGVLACSALPGCAHFGSDFEEPEVFLVGLRPLPGSGLEQRFEVELRVLNPNDADLEIDGFDVTLAVNGARLTRGLSSEEVRIPRLGESMVTLVATTTLFDLVQQIVRAPEATGFDYELRGRVFLADSPARLYFSKKGSLVPDSAR